MTVYVKIHKINGRNALAKLAESFLEHGFKDTVLYNEGGWQDKNIFTVSPHLKFEDEQDATAYVLIFGGIISKILPII